MPNNFNIEVKISLPSLEPGKTDEAIKKALRASVIHLEGAVKDKITPFTRTGRLRSSIQHKVIGKAGIVGTRVVYARPVEYGHRSFKGHHYMRNAAREQEGRVRKIFRDHINREL